MPKKRKTKHASYHKEHHEHSLEHKIAENLVQLQKVHLDLAEKFDRLAREISQLLALFESAARSFAKQPRLGTEEKDKEFLDKIDKLLEQNKTIAKGISLLEERTNISPQQRYQQPQYPQQSAVQYEEYQQSPKPVVEEEGQEPHNPSMTKSERPLPKF